MVAKAATKAGEFFCFHCGKQVQDQEDACKGCGSVFDKVTEAFRCPRCSNLLPVGAASCPACDLGFKVRTISSGSNLSDDDKFLMKLIDWGKQGEATPPKPQLTRTMRASLPPPPPPPPPPIERRIATGPAKIPPPIKAQARVPMPEREAKGDIIKEIPKPIQEPLSKEPAKEIRKEQQEEPPKEIPGQIAVKIPEEETRPPDFSKEQGYSADIPADILGKLHDAEANLHKVATRNMNLLETMRKKKDSGGAGAPLDMNALFNQLQAGTEDMVKLESQIHQLREAAEARNAEKSTIPATMPLTGGQESQSLSNQALKKLLEEREKEIGDLRHREEELARKEELLNRKIRAYAVKKKEFETLEKQSETRKAAMAAEAPGGSNDQDFPTELVVDDKQQWLKEQSRIKSGLIEIRNQIAPQKGGMEYTQPQISSDLAEKMEILEEKLDDVLKERDHLAAQISKLEGSRNDVIELLRVLDQLLGKLPPEIIDEFSKSRDFKLYEKVLDDLNI